MSLGREHAVARRRVALFRSLYGGLAALAGVAALACLMPTGERPDRLLQMALHVVLAAGFATGMLWVRLHPFGCAVGLTGLSATHLIVALARGPSTPLDWGIMAFSAGSTLTAGAVVPFALPVQRLLREQPRLLERVARRRATGQRDPGRSPAPAIAAAAVLAVALLGAGLWLALAETHDAAAGSAEREVEFLGAEAAAAAAAQLPRRIDEFRAVWARSDAAALERMFSVDSRESLWPRVADVLERRGWIHHMPELGEPESYDRGPAKRAVHFPLDPVGILKTEWSYSAALWRLERLTVSQAR